jgi:REP element-mobilizing transposase RayT
MSEFTIQSGTEVWAYCLMPNHIHMVMVPAEEDGLRAALGEAHRRYTRYVNFREGWRGHLWQERFHSFTMDERYLLSTVRYVERNPVEATLCDYPQEWEWSSARAQSIGRINTLLSLFQHVKKENNCVFQLQNLTDIRRHPLNCSLQTTDPVNFQPPVVPAPCRYLDSQQFGELTESNWSQRLSKQIFLWRRPAFG